MTDKSLFIEETLLNSVKTLLAGRVNELLAEMEGHVPPVEFGEKSAGRYAVRPEIWLAECERTEKERIIQIDAYTVTVTLGGEERDCYAYASAVNLALWENPSLGGIVDRAGVAHKKYISPKHANCGEDWGVVLTLRLTVEGSEK
jgi:hypothetical protein